MKTTMNLKNILNENGLEIVKEVGMKYLEDNFNYLISGTGENDKELEIKLSETKFWTS